MSHLEFDRAFLIRLAPIVLKCRLDGLTATTADARVWHFLGQMDYGAEMSLIARRRLRELSSTSSLAGR